MKRNHRIGFARTLALVAILLSPSSFQQPAECEAQNRRAPDDYDYYSLALTSISNSASEASKLPDIPQRVKLLLQAAEILAPSQRDEAVRLLDLALVGVKQWALEEKAGNYQRHTTSTLRNEILALYARVDPEKTEALRKEFQAAAKSSTTNSVTSPKNETSFTQLRDRRAIADQSAMIALSLVDTHPEKALGLVVQSLRGGILSGVLFKIVQKLLQNGNRAFLNNLEIGMGQAIAVNVTLDPTSLAFGSALIQADKSMPLTARTAFIGFLLRSVQAQSDLVRDLSNQGTIDASYVRGVFTMAILNVRPIVLQYSPEQLVTFEIALDKVAAFVPTKTRSRLQAFQPETFSDPRERLNDILKDPAPGKRDLRLVRLVSELLRITSEDFEKNFELASDAISGFSDPNAKSAYGDLLTITRIDAFVKQRKFIEAQQLAGSLSSEETRAWAWLALSSVAAKSEQILGFELISNALKALDKASPSPRKVELALIATAMLAKNDPQRAFDTLSTASRYANSSASKIDPPTRPPVAFGLEAIIGEANTRLGVVPESLAELKINPLIASLGTKDWFRADQIVSDIREPSLRLQLKLQFAGAVFAQETKPRKKDATPVKNTQYLSH